MYPTAKIKISLSTPRMNVQQGSPNLFSLAYPLAAPYHKPYLHVSKMFVINIVAVISNLYIVTVNK